eukprot:3693754-Ditylum_brightwellii.AAC.1
MTRVTYPLKVQYDPPNVLPLDFHSRIKTIAQHNIYKMAVEAESEIILEGVPFKEMGNNKVAIFEKTIKKFLNGAIKSTLETNDGVEALAVIAKKQKSRKFSPKDNKFAVDLGRKL